MSLLLAIIYLEVKPSDIAKCVTSLSKGAHHENLSYYRKIAEGTLLQVVNVIFGIISTVNASSELIPLLIVK